MKPILKKSNKNELSDIAKIYMAEFSKPPYSEKWTIKKANKKISFYYEFYDLYSIKIDKNIIGFIVINPSFMCPGEVAFGEEFAISEDFQNKGIGTFIINEIMKIYKAKGFKKFIGISDVNSRAFNLYKRLGIKPSKTNLLIEKKLK